MIRLPTAVVTLFHTKEIKIKLTQTSKPTEVSLSTTIEQINELTPEDVVNLFSYLINEKVEIITKFYPSQGDVITHQSLVCYYKDYVAESEPSELEVPLTPVAITATLTKSQIN